jgi:biotin carboxylase
MTNVLMISPGYPAEMAFFTRGLGQAGATIIGLGDQSPEALPPIAKEALDHYVHTGSLADEDHVVATVRGLARHVRIDQVECLWEPYMVLAARLREDLGLPGLTVAQTVPFRDKERMKQLLDAAGLRTPRHRATETVAGVWAAAEQVGYPLIVKPIDGAGSADTYRADSAADLDAVLPSLRHVPRVSVEEFVEAEEFTYDTICAGGQVLVENICQYHPRPLQTKLHEWISPVTLALRDLDAPGLAVGRELGRSVLRALGFSDGFTHMEWYRKADGEVVFGEIGARPPGARTVDVMNYATDADLFTAWAYAVTQGSIPFPVERRYNAASIFKRAQGAGRITRYEGLDRLLAEYGDHVAAIDLLPLGAPRRDWRATLIADGMVIVRHPDLEPALDMARRFAADLHLFAEGA